MSLVNPAALLAGGPGTADHCLLHPEDPPAPDSGIDPPVLAADLRGEKAAVAVAAAAALALAALAACVSGVPGFRAGRPDLPLAAGAGAAAGAGRRQLLEHERHRRAPQPARGGQGRRPAADRRHAPGRRAGDHRRRGAHACRLRADRPRANPARGPRFDHAGRRTDPRRPRPSRWRAACFRAPRRCARSSCSPTAALTAPPSSPARKTSS